MLMRMCNNNNYH